MEFQNQEKCNFGGKKCVVGEIECKYSENNPQGLKCVQFYTLAYNKGRRFYLL